MLSVAYLIFNLRSPILVLTEQSFVNLYGAKRIRNEAFRVSFAFFRPVKTVEIAGDAGEDIVPHAIAEVSGKPYCVVFPFRFSRSATAYSEQNPAVPVIILEGRHQYRRLVPGLFVYKTDIEADFYRAGLAAAIMTTVYQGNVAVIMEPRQFSAFRDTARPAFSRGMEEKGSTRETLFFHSLSEVPQSGEYACVMLAGTGSDYFDRKTGVPVIMYSWLDTSLVPMNTALVFDDSPWAQLRDAVSLFSAGEEQGTIKSKISIFNRNFDRRILQKVRQIR